MAVEVTKMEDLLGNSKKPSNDSESDDESVEDIDVKQSSQTTQIPKGKYKSGRIWKEPRKRFSSVVKTRGIRLSFEKKQQLRQELKTVKEMSRAVVAEKKAAKEAKKERRRENLKKAEENRKKSEIVQVITNTSKIKRMKKKQLRMIEKRDTTKV